MISFEYKNEEWVIQAYDKDEFVNIGMVNQSNKIAEWWFKIQFHNGKITTSSFETEKWKEIRDKIDVGEIKRIVDNIFDSRLKQVIK